MKKKGVINLTEYFYYKQETSLRRYAVFLILLPLLLSTIFGILKFSSICLILFNGIIDKTGLEEMVKDILTINAKFNVASLILYFFKNTFLAIYVIAINAVIKERMILKFSNVRVLLSHHLLECMGVGFILALIEWILIKIPLLGVFLTFALIYFAFFTILFLIQDERHGSIRFALTASIKFTFSNILNLFALDFYFLSMPFVIGITIIIFTNTTALITSQVLIMFFGVIIAILAVLKKIPKAFLARIIYYLTFTKK